MGPVGEIRRSGSASSNSSYSWIGGGQVGPKSSVDRVDFLMVHQHHPKGPLSVRISTSTGNASYGWWMGGGYPSKTTKVDRIDYSNDSNIS